MGKRDKIFSVFGRKEKTAPSPVPPTVDGTSEIPSDNFQQPSRSQNGTPTVVSEAGTGTVGHSSVGLKNTTAAAQPAQPNPAQFKATTGSPEDPSHAQKPPSSIADFSGTQHAATSPALGAAYRAAWTKLSDEEQALLIQDADIKELFIELEKTNKDHAHDNVLRRGMIALKPWLQGIQGVINISQPFLSLEPTASNGTGLVSGCLSIATALCGAVDKITPQIQAFLERIPVLKRCDAAIKTPSQLQNVHDKLVAMYDDLFRFYLLASRMFHESRFMLQTLKNVWKPEISDVMDSFNGHADALSKLLESETFAAVQEIKDEQAETLIRDLFDTDRKKEVHYYNQLQKRSDNACHWILEDEKFNTWRLQAQSGMLVMLGDMGSGKTMMSAFVADRLAKAYTACAHYCKDDGETNQLVSIYRSFLWQLLKRRSSLKPVFRQWYKERASGPIDPTQDVEKLEAFLREAFTVSETWTYLIVDGLDECSFATSQSLMSLFRESFDRDAKLKVFVSSRYNAEIGMLQLPEETDKLHFVPSADRDRMLTDYLVEHSAIPDKVSAKVIKVLSTNAQGSAIWLRIALEYLARLLIRTESGVDLALNQLTASRDLAGMYWKLYDQMFSELPEFQASNVQIALEILAIAQRPLTGSELSVAVFTNLEDEQAETIEELHEISAAFDLVGQIRPFISALKDDEGHEHGLRLVHQSLKELILKAPPDGWQEAGKAKKDRDERRRLLESEMMKRCIKYMLYDECNEVDLAERFNFSEHEADFALLGMFGGGIDDWQNAESEEAKPKESKTAGATDTFDPAEAGLGPFYGYSAVHWYRHFAEIDPLTGAPDREDVITVCARGTNRLKNWLEVSCRPDLTIMITSPWAEPRDTDYADPVLITASLGCPQMVPSIIGDSLDVPEFFEGTVWRAAERLTKRDAGDVLITLMKNDVTRDELLVMDFFSLLANRWRNTGQQVDKKVLKSRGDVFKFLITETKESIVMQNGNAILCDAAHMGCLPLLEKLFEAASRDAALKDAILTPDPRRVRPYSPISLHQSVGEALWAGHEDAAAWLCKQDGIEPHIHYVNRQGSTVYHQAARRGHLRALELLIEVWPEGINLVSEDGSTGLDMLLRNHNMPNIYDSIRIMLDHGAEVGDWIKTEGGDGGPVCFAKRGAGKKVCDLMKGKGRDHICLP